MEDILLVQPNNMFVDIRFQDVSFTTVQKDGGGKKEILKSVSGEFRSGELTAIIGPSGAGKSTLMSCIAGFKVSNVSGKILVNDKERRLDTFRKISSYIMQRDELCPVLSVIELMKFAANLKLGHNKSNTEKEHLINQILETMGLSHSTTTITAKLSGGQKKRLAIALELINNPQIMFFDEPTSGLDSASSFQCVSLMKTLARSGKTIICVIHQPSSTIFEMFDHLYLLAKGQCIYQGAITDVVRNISATTGVMCPDYHNPADYAIDVASGLYGDFVGLLVKKADNDRLIKNSLENVRSQRNSESHTLLEQYVTRDDMKNNNEMSEKNHISCSSSSSFSRWRRRSLLKPTNDISFWIQFCVIFHKTIICVLRDRVLITVRAAVQLITAIVVGLTYQNIGDESSQVFNNFGLIIFVQLSLMFTALMTTCLTYPLERVVLVREHLNNWHRLDIYYLAKTIADLPFEIFFSSIFVIIVYFMTSQPPDATRFFMFWGMAVMTSLVAQSIGLALGASLNLRAAVFMGPPVTIPFYLFSGFLIRFNEIPNYMHWLCYTSFIRYGFEGMIIAIYANDRQPLRCAQEFCFFKSPLKILQWFGLENSVYSIDVFALFMFFILLRVSTFFILRWKLKSKL